MLPGIQRVMHLTSFADEERERPRLRYWLSRPPAERVAAVEFLRRQVHGYLAPDFDEFIGCLIAHGVDFVIVGYALAFHGAPRFTGDLDILVRPTPDNAARLLTALDSFGCPALDLSPEAVADRSRMLQMGVLGRQTFLRNKRAAARPKDLADIDARHPPPAKGHRRQTLPAALAAVTFVTTGGVVVRHL